MATYNVHDMQSYWRANILWQDNVFTNKNNWICTSCQLYYYNNLMITARSLDGRWQLL